MSTDTQIESQSAEFDSQNDTTNPEASASEKKSRRPSRALVAIVVLLLLAVGIGWYLYSSRFEDTDDAQVDGHLDPIAARVDGTVVAVHVEDNQIIQAGTPLVDLDPRDSQVAVDQAQAQADQAAAQVSAAHPNLPITQISNRTDLASQQAALQDAAAALAAARHDLDTANAKLKESQAVSERNDADYKRYQILYAKNEVSRADFDQYRATALAQTETVAANQAAVLSAQKTVEQRQAQLSEQRSKLQQTIRSAPLQVSIRQADIKSQQANAEAAQASLEKARLNLSYCHIVAPVSGVITERSAELGSRISAGQQLLMIVETDDLWVTANFKETQLARMRPGQQVRIHVDALHEDFAGTVESMPAVTGARTSVLPPENATGNYVKVIQRMPVRIRFTPNQKNLDLLRPGMSVEPKVSLD